MLRSSPSTSYSASLVVCLPEDESDLFTVLLSTSPPLQVQIHTRRHFHFESFVISLVEYQAPTLFPVEILFLQLRAP